MVPVALCYTGLEAFSAQITDGTKVTGITWMDKVTNEGMVWYNRV